MFGSSKEWCNSPTHYFHYCTIIPTPTFCFLFLLSLCQHFYVFMNSLLTVVNRGQHLCHCWKKCLSRGVKNSNVQLVRHIASGGSVCYSFFVVYMYMCCTVKLDIYYRYHKEDTWMVTTQSAHIAVICPAHCYFQCSVHLLYDMKFKKAYIQQYGG